MLLSIVIVHPHVWLKFSKCTVAMLHLATEAVHVSHSCGCPRSVCSSDLIAKQLIMNGVSEYISVIWFGFPWCQKL